MSWPLNRILGWCFYVFNKGFDAATSVYTRVVGGLLRVSVLVLVLYGGLLGFTYWGFTHTPTGFIPSQDKGYLLVNVQLPDSSSLERTQDVMGSIGKLAGGYDLRLISSASDIPKEGRGLVVLADVDQALQIRVFDLGGQMVVDANEKMLAERVQEVGDLKKQLVNLWAPHKVTKAERRRVVDAVTSIVGHTEAHGTPGVESVVAIAGQSILLNANAPNFGTDVCDARRFPPSGRSTVYRAR